MKTGNLAWWTCVACLALLCGACGKTADSDQSDGDPQEPGPGSMAEPMAGAGAEPAEPDEPGSGNTDDPAEPDEPANPDDPAEPMNPDEPVVAPGTLPSARGMCDLDTGFPGDEACLKPPAPDEGFQIHIGPSDYDDPAQVEEFVFDPGEESSQCYLKKLILDHAAHYMVYELSGRPGTHHIINTIRTDSVADGWGMCAGSMSGTRIGGASKPHMPPLPIAPENEGLAFPLAAQAQAQHDMHYFNFTEEPILREFWMNLYFVPDAEVTQTPGRIGGLGGFGWSSSPIQPGTHMVYPYECPIDTDGRIITLLGHTHAHALRETAHIRRADGSRQKVFEQYDYLEPMVFMYDSITENPGFSDSAPGAHTGLLEVKAGDVLEWECEVNNTSTVGLRYTNQVQTGEMCNIWGTTVGPTISCFLP